MLEEQRRRRQRPKTLDEIAEMSCAFDVLCEECGSRRAACVCEACDDQMLCVRCFRLIHPRRADGAEHDHLKASAARPIDKSLATRALSGSLAKLEPASRVLARDDLEITEEDLEAAGVDLSRPTSVQEAPKICLDTGRDSRSSLRERQVVIFVLRDGLHHLEGRCPRYTKHNEGWGVVHQASMHSTVTTKDSGERVYQISCFDSPVSADYEKETRVAEREEAMFRQAESEAQKRRSGTYAAIYLGFNSLHRQSLETRIDQVALPSDNARIVDVLECDIFLPRDLRNSLRERKARACRSALHSVDVRLANQSMLERFQKWSKQAAFEIEQERKQAATLLVRAWKKKLRHGMDLGRAGINHLMVRRYGLEKRRFEPLLYLPKDEKMKCYSTDQRIFFRTRKELEEYALALRDVGKVVCGKMLDRASANKRFAFTKWRDVWLAIVDKEKLITPHIDAYTLGEQTEIATSSMPWHPAIGIKLPRLPNLWSKPRAHRRFIENTAKYNSMRTAMQGPTDNSNWVVPGMLLIGPHPSGPARTTGKMDDVIGSGVALIQSNVRVFVDLCPATESSAQEAKLGARWKQYVDEGRRMRENDVSDLGCAMYIALQQVSEKLSRAIANATSALSRAKNELAACPRYDDNDLRYEDAERDYFIALAKERMLMKDADKKGRQLKKLPESLEVVRYPIDEDDCGDDENVLLELCELIETRLRARQTVYVYSRRGHGRAGMVGALVLGRLYGLSAADALDRMQVYHDSRRAYRLANDESRVISCPQSLRQIAAVHRLLVHTDTIYSEHCTKGRWQATFQQKERGKGVPTSLLPQTREAKDKRSPLMFRREKRKLPSIAHFRPEEAG